jgi:hypothetical protein
MRTFSFYCYFLGNYLPGVSAALPQRILFDLGLCEKSFFGASRQKII